MLVLLFSARIYGLLFLYKSPCLFDKLLHVGKRNQFSFFCPQMAPGSLNAVDQAYIIANWSLLSFQ
jgi:hypothetical protein